MKLKNFLVDWTNKFSSFDFCSKTNFECTSKETSTLISRSHVVFLSLTRDRNHRAPNNKSYSRCTGERKGRSVPVTSKHRDTNSRPCCDITKQAHNKQKPHTTHSSWPLIKPHDLLHTRCLRKLCSGRAKESRVFTLNRVYSPSRKYTCEFTSACDTLVHQKKREKKEQSRDDAAPPSSISRLYRKEQEYQRWARPAENKTRDCVQWDARARMGVN